MNAVRRRIILFLLVLIFFHAAHILEEVWANFWPVGRYYSQETFIILNLIFFAIPLFMLYYFLLEKKWSVYLCLIYGIVMTLNGLGHNIMTLVTGKYFGGFAGGFSGIGLIAAGIPLAYYVSKHLKEIKSGKNG